MDHDLKKHLDRLLSRATATLALAVTALVFLVLALVFFWAQKAVAFVFFLLIIASALAFALLGHLARREAHKRLPQPVSVPALRPLSFEELDVTLRQMTGEESVRNLHGSTLLYDVHDDVEARIILYKTPAFDKKEFDNLRRQIEQEAGEPSPDAYRLYLVCVSRTDAALALQVTDNAMHGISHAGGALFAAVYHDKIDLPPLYGRCAMRDVRRYRQLVHFVERKLA